MKLKILLAINFTLLIILAGLEISYAQSDAFPPYKNAPALYTYVEDGAFNNTYYISPSGNDSSGTGSIERPWATINGARTGGAGKSVAAGDLVYFRGGSYSAALSNKGPNRSSYYIDLDGTSSDRIVFSAYPGENPIFESPSDDHISLTIEGDYIVFDSLTFSTGCLTIYGGQHAIVQNCNFVGHPYRGNSSQINSAYLYICSGGHYANIRNCYFQAENAHAIKPYGSERMPTNIVIEYNRFFTGSVSYGIINFKTAITNYYIRYNRFENISADCISVGSSYTGNHNGLFIHHNVFDDCRNSIFTKLQTASTGDLINLEFNNNLILNAISGDRDLFEFDTSDGISSTESQAIGEVWNNVIYGIKDAIDSENDYDFTNYPNFWNYNAYASENIKETAENHNDLPVNVWNGAAVIKTDSGILSIGEDGNKFYFIENESQFIGAGRNSSNIGGFSFGGVSNEGQLQSPNNLRKVNP